MEPLMKPAAEPAQNAALLRLVARREHNLLALMELCRHLAQAADLYGIVDTVLLSVMGQIGARRGAIWFVSPTDPNALVLARAKGVPRRRTRALTMAAGGPVLELVRRRSGPVLLEDLTASPATHRLAADGDFVVLLPVLGGAELLGIFALGQRVDGASYGELDLQLLQSTTALLGIMVQNARARQNLAESNRQLALANEAQGELEELKDQFLRNVHHELRTPLSAIIGCADLLADQHLPERDEIVDSIHESAARLSKLIASVLELGSLEARCEPECELMDLDKFLEVWCTRRKPGVHHGLRELLLNPGESRTIAWADPRGLTSVLDALVDNACKFTPEGSTIAIEVGKETRAGTDWVTISVADEGPGIARDRLESVFEPFVQGDGSMTRRHSGLGIGLAVARGVSRTMGGDLEVASVLGEGTTLTCYLRAQAPH
jgi:signal transduction histidine kinase